MNACGDSRLRGLRSRKPIGFRQWVVHNCGSYSLVMKPPFILPNFPVLDISEGEVELIKRAETFEDIFHTYNI